MTKFSIKTAAAALAALGDEPWMRSAVDRIRVERERVRRSLTDLGLRVAPSQGNFLFFDCGTDSSSLAAELVKDGSNGYIFRHEDATDLAKKIRKSIVDDKNLSTYAHNVKIIARGGTVVLKGPVRSEEEKTAIEAKTVEIAGAANVKNELTVKSKTE